MTNFGGDPILEGQSHMLHPWHGFATTYSGDGGFSQGCGSALNLHRALTTPKGPAQSDEPQSHSRTREFHRPAASRPRPRPYNHSVPARKTSLKKTAAKPAPPQAQPYFTQDSLKFLRALKRNNRRDWFDPRKPLFESTLKAPMLMVIEAVTHAMTAFAPEHVRPAPKCMMRIYRDTRFSNDKTPYKNQVAAWWSRHGLEKTSGGGFFFHLSSTELVIAAGVYMPEREQLLAIRAFLLDHHGELRKLLNDKKLRQLFELDHGELLSRPPKGFAKEHRAMDLLKCRQWAVVAKLAPEAALEPSLVQQIVTHFRAAAPLVALLNRPLQPPAEAKRQPLFGLY